MKVGHDGSSAARFGSLAVYAGRAASAARASRVRASKNADDWPMKSPSAVRAFAAPIAAPSVLVGRMIEQTGNFRSRNTVGSGMIRLVWKSSPPNGGAFRSGNSRPLVGSLSAGALPALSIHVWKCIVSVGPMLSRIRRTSGSLTRCTSDG